ncbi:PIG-L family deacetylase, partial [Cellulomonas septica]|nr:GlcNAc-PI de-N-acetylase [Cellulomonas septica]
MAPVGGLLAVHAHPDDETLSTGALLATWARAGLPVMVVTCTRGERGEVIGDALAHLEGDEPALAAHRDTELAAALSSLGVADHAFLDATGPAG